MQIHGRDQQAGGCAGIGTICKAGALILLVVVAVTDPGLALVLVLLLLAFW